MCSVCLSRVLLGTLSCASSIPVLVLALVPLGRAPLLLIPAVSIWLTLHSQPKHACHPWPQSRGWPLASRRSTTTKDSHGVLRPVPVRCRPSSSRLAPAASHAAEIRGPGAHPLRAGLTHDHKYEYGPGGESERIRVWPTKHPSVHLLSHRRPPPPSVRWGPCEDSENPARQVPAHWIRSTDTSCEPDGAQSTCHAVTVPRMGRALWSTPRMHRKMARRYLLR